MSDYFFIEIAIDDQNLLTSLEQAAFENFNCEGSEDYSLEEEAVDAILGDRSYSGGDLPLEVLEEVEQALISQGHNKKKLFFKNMRDAVSFQKFLKDREVDVPAIIESGKNQDWNESWKKSFKTIQVGQQLAIVPSWEKTSDSKNGNVYIYPGMGFGTGNHETTFLCLKLMLEEIRDLEKLESCLDYGCGSGILGISLSVAVPGIKLIDYLDIDQQALENCQQNIDLNEKAKKTKSRLLLSTQKEVLEPGYDLVFANILKQTLLEEKRDIVEKTNKRLIISGLLKGQEVEVIEAYQKLDPSLVLEKTLFKNDWSAALLSKKH